MMMRAAIFGVILLLSAGLAMAAGTGGHGGSGHGEGHGEADHGGYAAAADGPLCVGYGPQTPRDIASAAGSNPRRFSPAPAAADLNLCNIHTHTNAEHKGPGFRVFKGAGDHGGYACNGTDQLTADQLRPVDAPHFDGVAPGDTIEVHWVFTSCDVEPGAGLGACLSDACANPDLRVEAQVFLLANDPGADDFLAYAWDGNRVDGRPQPRALPRNTGNPVVFLGSTTGPQYSEQACSPLQVTWSVRPFCRTLDINSLHEWGRRGNVFDEHHSHGVRQLVTAPELLSRIE